MLIRVRAVFVGRVQGVGFRATCQEVAGEFGLTGWVRNEHDGTVVAEVQGPRKAVDRFCEAVSERTFGRVDRFEQFTMEATVLGGGFVLR